MAKKNLQTKKEIPSEEDYSYTSEEIPSNTILSSTSSQTPLQGPIGPDVIEEFQRLRILEYKSRMSAVNADIKHKYVPIDFADIGPTGINLSINDVTEGSQIDQRTTATIINHGATIRLTISKVTTTPLNANQTYQTGVRVIFARYHIPIAINDLFFGGDTNPPINGEVPYVNPGSNANITRLSYVRNQNTFHNWDIIYDKVHMLPQQLAGVGNGSTFIVDGTEHLVLHFDMKKHMTQFADSTSTSAVLNKYFFNIQTNENEAGLTIPVRGLVDFTFSEASNI